MVFCIACGLWRDAMFFQEEERKIEPRFRPKLINEPSGSFLCKIYLLRQQNILKSDLRQPFRNVIIQPFVLVVI